MLDAPELASVLRDVPLITVQGPWVRVIAFEYLHQSLQPLWTDPACRNPGRFSPTGSFRALYLTSDVATAQAEVERTFLHPGLVRPVHIRDSWTFVRVDGVVNGVLDLTDPAIQHALNTNLTELTNVWRVGAWRKDVPPTHVLGMAAYSSSAIRGFRYVSACLPGHGINCVFFVDRLRPATDVLEVLDPHGTLSQRLP